MFVKQSSKLRSFCPNIGRFYRGQAMLSYQGRRKQQNNYDLPVGISPLVTISAKIKNASKNFLYF
jgi:hypothetical protein